MTTSDQQTRRKKQTRRLSPFYQEILEIRTAPRNAEWSRPINWPRKDMRGAMAENMCFADANLRGSDLSGSWMSGADFSNANLSRCIMRGAELWGANFAGANLLRANISGAIFADRYEGVAVGLTQAQIDSAIADPDDPPILDGVLDAETGEPLVWRGGLEAESERE